MHGCPVDDGRLLHVLRQAAESVSTAFFVFLFWEESLHVHRCQSYQQTERQIKQTTGEFRIHSFASQPEVTRAPIVAAIREHARRSLPSGENRKEPIPFDKVEEACKVLACWPSGRLRNLALAAAISLGFCGFFRYEGLAHIRVGGISKSSDGASMKIFLESRKNDQYRQDSYVHLSAKNLYACPVGFTCFSVFFGWKKAYMSIDANHVSNPNDL